MRSRGHLALRRALRVLEALDDPDAALLVDGEGDRVDDLRLGGEQLDLELRRRTLNFATDLLGLQVRLAGRLAVVEAELLLGQTRRNDNENGSKCEGGSHGEVLEGEREA